jgi:8-oxo-dGTP pyrophosphatase MutT (NUDIX family)
MVDSNEDPLDTAKRELLEETGYSPRGSPQHGMAARPRARWMLAFSTLASDTKSS